MKNESLTSLEKLLEIQYNPRYNEVTGRVEVRQKTRYEAISDRLTNEIWRLCIKTNTPARKEDIIRVLESDFVPVYNPFRSYLENLPQWDGTDYIQQLADTVTVTNKAFWDKYLRKWLVSLAVSMYVDGSINHQVLTLMGRQGLGKSTWLDGLVPWSLKNHYYTGTIDPDSKDTLIHLSECMLIHLDELENLSRKNLGSLKQIITQGFIRLRRPYGRFNMNLPRRASFVASVNNPRFLNDPTGSRRFLCFEATCIEYIHTVNLDQVYAQALYLYLTGFQYHLDTQDEQEVTQENEQFTVESVENNHLTSYFEVADEETATDVLSTTDVLNFLHTQVGLQITNVNLQRLGKSLTRHGFVRVKRQNVYKYLLRRKETQQSVPLFNFDNLLIPNPN